VAFVVCQRLSRAFEQARLEVTDRRHARVSLLQKRKDPGLHLAGSFICEREGQDFVGMRDTTQKPDESSNQEHGLSGPGRGFHVVASGHVQGKVSGLMV
jgi:hypothetical protein